MGNGPDIKKFSNQQKVAGTHSQPTERLGAKVNSNGSNLRDFRIDNQNSASEFSTPRSLISQRKGFEPTQNEGVEKRPQQKIVARGLATSMSEWTSSDEEFLNTKNHKDETSNSLWGDWKQELQESAQANSSEERDLKIKSTDDLSRTTSEYPERGVTLKNEDMGEIPWAAELALSERKAEREGYVDFSNSYQKQEVLKVRTLEFVNSLQKAFREQVEIFNQTRKSPAHSIQVYKVSKTQGDFMLFRNGVKLVVSGQRSGRVLFAFNQYLGQIFTPTQNPTIEIEAEWGPFDQLFWSYKNERVQIQDIVRYFTLEFVNQSFK
jgi:hypothetical protein